MHASINVKVSQNDLWEFNLNTQSSAFLFGDDLNQFLKELHGKAVEIHVHSKVEDHDPMTHRDQEHARIQNEALKWFAQFVDNKQRLTEKFLPYLGFREAISAKS
jgi:hypothetical protein